MRIAIFDFRVVSSTPVGGRQLQIIRALCREHEFTVFACEFENPSPENVEFVKIPRIPRVPILPYVIYHLCAPFYYLVYRLGHRHFDIIQMVESNLSFGDISISPFCHRTFVKYHWRQARAAGIRGYVRWVSHWLHALVESWIYRRVRWVVVPSDGIAKELITAYPFTENKICKIPNAVDVAFYRRPDDFDRTRFRTQLGLAGDDIALTFIALGHFERKGLPLLLDAMQRLKNNNLKLVVVGGQREGLISSYKNRVERLGLAENVVFSGLQKDVRPFLWSVDAFVLPSSYEGFALVLLQAAAAGLPPISTRVNGAEELIRDGENGILIDRTIEGICRGISNLLEFSPSERRQMGMRAERDVQKFNLQNYVEAWRTLYRDTMPREATSHPTSSTG